GFFCIKVNLSHNGTRPDDPLNFSDLEAFANDTFSHQLNDLKAVLDFIEQTPDIPLNEMDVANISLIGHSRGGSLVLLKGAQDARVTKIITWSAVADLLAGYTPEEIAAWKETGVKTISNTRTKQQMPIYYSYYEDLMNHPIRLNVLQAASRLDKPLLVIHGDKDETIPISDAYSIHQHAADSKLIRIEGANHTFGSAHPWNEETLPPHLKATVEATVMFLKEK
ncbi:MAG: prolyl oligopeptidase family serine peptidase, partial [Cytophagales bacterium]|nr:prolyl oligopeptidase family serine peptidase [Cytophaga sp.]